MWSTERPFENKHWPKLLHSKSGVNTVKSLKGLLTIQLKAGPKMSNKTYKN